MKLPAFQFYPGDWRKDTGVQSLDYEARGVWFEILCLMHESERRGVLTLNGKAMPETALSRLLGLDDVLLKQILTKLEDHGVASREQDTGALFSRRMVRDENLRKIRTEAGSKGGNPILLNQKSTTEDKQIPTPSVSPSASALNTSIAHNGARDEFDQFWKAYPRKVAKPAAFTAWKSKKPPLQECLSAILIMREKDDWKRDDGKFIPYPQKWINQGRWLDLPTEPLGPTYIMPK